MMELINWYIIV